MFTLLLCEQVQEVIPGQDSHIIPRGMGIARCINKFCNCYLLRFSLESIKKYLMLWSPFGIHLVLSTHWALKESSSFNSKATSMQSEWQGQSSGLVASPTMPDGGWFVGAIALLSYMHPKLSLTIAWFVWADAVHWGGPMWGHSSWADDGKGSSPIYPKYGPWAPCP